MNDTAVSPAVGNLTAADHRRPSGAGDAPQPRVYFLWSAGVLLLVTGLAKAFAATGQARVLDVPDPLLSLPFRQLMLTVGLMELLVAFFCLCTPRRSFSATAVAWLATNFLLYRAGLWLIGWHRPCNCMGSLTDLLHLSPTMADNVMKAILAYLLAGSYLVLYRFHRQGAGNRLSVRAHSGVGVASALAGRGTSIMAIGLTIPACSFCHAGGLSFEGQLERFQQNQSTPSKVFWFEGVSSDAKWILKTYEGGLKQQFGHVEYGFDGTNQYRLEFGNHEPFPVAAAKTNFIFINGDVSPRIIPATSYTLLHVYWLAFRCSIYGNEQVAQLPWEFIYRAPEGSTNKRVIQAVYSSAATSSSAVSLDEVSLLNPGFEYGMKADYPLSAPYDKGFVVARFKVLERQSIGALSVPTLFEWHVYRPRSGGASSNDLDVVYLARGKVTRVSPVDADFSAVPRAPENLTMAVTDYRMQKESGVPGGVYISRGRFLNPDEREYQSQLNRLRNLAGSATRSRPVVTAVYVGFLAVSFCALLLFLRMRRRTPVSD